MTAAETDHVDHDAHEHTLDALIWHALNTTHARFAEGGALARRYDPEVAGFVAIRDGSPASWAALADLVGPGETVLLSAGDGIEPPSNWTIEGGGRGYQMILRDLPPSAPIDLPIVRLTERHVDQMLELVELAQPGPFRRRTVELGDYFGVFDDGQLVAMAGERLQTPHHTEISAVCTHPTARGRGLASALTRRVAAGVFERGQTPILHVAEHNDNAKRVYERLGFVVRAQPQFVAARTPDQQAHVEQRSTS